VKKLTYALLATSILLTSALKAEASSFAGPFFGLQLGDTKTTERVSDDNFFQGANPDAPVDFNIDPKGVTGGVIGGYRWQFNKYIVGLEATGQITNGRSATQQYNNGTDEFDTQFSRGDTLLIGPKFGYLFMDKMMGYVGVDYALGQFRSHQQEDGIDPTTCGSGDCPNHNFLMQGVGFNAGLEFAATDTLNLRLDYEHTAWQSTSVTDSAGDTARISPTDNSVRAAVIYAFK
jgi:opacity protein-like surface antigen